MTSFSVDAEFSAPNQSEIIIPFSTVVLSSDFWYPAWMVNSSSLFVVQINSTVAANRNRRKHHARSGQELLFGLGRSKVIYVSTATSKSQFYLHYYRYRYWYFDVPGT